MHIFFYFLISLLLPISTAAQSFSNKSLGSLLTASNENSAASWISQSGEFAFGFQQIGDQGFLLAIWFNKIPERTITWSANRNDLVQRGSKVELTREGQLILGDSTGKEIWRAEPVSTGVAYAAMLDTGNFVLASQNSSTLWASFDHPTDTLLPTQVMNQGTRVYARVTETNYSSGRFMFEMQRDGILVLYTTFYPLKGGNAPYWLTQTSGSGYQVVFNTSGFIYLISRNGSILNSVTSNLVSNQDFYQRAIVDSDGVFRHYAYPKTSASSGGRWPKTWSPLSFIPSNICMNFQAATGSGACGYNSYCSMGSDQKKLCQCPPGYTFFDPNDVMKGCKQNFVPQSCEKPAEEMDLFEFREMSNTYWPLADYEHFQRVNEDWCREVCLSDCFCAVAIFHDGECWKKRAPLSNGRIDPSIGGKSLIKVRKDNSSDASTRSDSKNNSTLIYILSVTSGSSIFVILLFMLVSFIFLHRLNQRKLKKVKSQKGIPEMNLLDFTYKELEVITGGFKEELGAGAFGKVYKGVLATANNENLVAVKKLNKTVNEGEQEFKAEIRAIGRTNHKNLVQLLGFCNEGEHRLLVYEYMSTGSLADFLFGNSRPNWYKRMQIAFGTARGLFYLHEECNSQIIHCDIKPQNVLVDDYLTARISDFGLAKLLKTDQTQTTTAIRGTKGYVAPEWFKNLPITVKVDVYSFGILLLELVCCRRNFEVDAKEECQMILADWAYDCFREGKLDLLVENDEEAKDDIKRVEKFVMIAIWCIQEDPSLRPTMKKVTQMMEGAVEVSIPPDPVSFISSI